MNSMKGTLKIDGVEVEITLSEELLDLEWRFVSFDHGYICSEYGHIYSLPKVWKSGRSNGKIQRHSGQLLSHTLHHQGYYLVKLRCKQMPVHKVVAYTFHGEPQGDKTYIDHINRNSIDNHYSNLRFVTPRGNSLNRTPSKGKTSKYMGVSKPRKSKKYIAAISSKGKTRHLGTFECELEAAKAYNKAAKELHGELAYINPLPLHV